MSSKGQSPFAYRYPTPQQSSSAPVPTKSSTAPDLSSNASKSSLPDATHRHLEEKRLALQKRLDELKAKRANSLVNNAPEPPETPPAPPSPPPEPDPTKRETKDFPLPIQRLMKQKAVVGGPEPHSELQAAFVHADFLKQWSRESFLAQIVLDQEKIDRERGTQFSATDSSLRDSDDAGDKATTNRNKSHLAASPPPQQQQQQEQQGKVLAQQQRQQQEPESRDSGTSTSSSVLSSSGSRQPSVQYSSSSPIDSSTQFYVPGDLEEASGTTVVASSTPPPPPLQRITYELSPLEQVGSKELQKVVSAAGECLCKSGWKCWTSNPCAPVPQAADEQFQHRKNMLILPRHKVQIGQFLLSRRFLRGFAQSSEPTSSKQLIIEFDKYLSLGLKHPSALAALQEPDELDNEAKVFFEQNGAVLDVLQAPDGIFIAAAISLGLIDEKVLLEHSSGAEIPINVALPAGGPMRRPSVRERSNSAAAFLSTSAPLKQTITTESMALPHACSSSSSLSTPTTAPAPAPAPPLNFAEKIAVSPQQRSLKDAFKRVLSLRNLKDTAKSESMTWDEALTKTSSSKSSSSTKKASSARGAGSDISRNSSSGSWTASSQKSTDPTSRGSAPGGAK